MLDLDRLIVSDVQQENILMIVVNFLMCALLAFIVRSFYIRYSKSLTGKNHVGSILPILSLIVFLVILVVKSSLALSLGLVGALSIVRFRTPIKEPEELVYLFLSIAIGLGFGAGFTILTTLTVLSILVVVYVFLGNKVQSASDDYNLIVSWKSKDIDFSEIIDVASEFCSSVSLVRLSDNDVERACVLSVERNPNAKMDDIIAKLSNVGENIEINMYQANTNW